MRKRLVGDITTPCNVGWENMQGDERVRFCQHCSLNVYNLAEMTDDEVKQLVAERPPGRLCVRMTKRPDGTIVTNNCPVFLRRFRSMLLRRAPWVLAAWSIIFSHQMAHAQVFDDDDSWMPENKQDTTQSNFVRPPKPVPELQGATNGTLTTLNGQPVPETPPPEIGLERSYTHPLPSERSLWAAFAALVISMAGWNDLNAVKHRILVRARAGECLVNMSKEFERHRKVLLVVCIVWALAIWCAFH